MLDAATLVLAPDVFWVDVVDQLVSPAISIIGVHELLHEVRARALNALVHARGVLGVTVRGGLTQSDCRFRRWRAGVPREGDHVFQSKPISRSVATGLEAWSFWRDGGVGQVGSGFPHGLTLQFDGVSIVQQPIEDGVCDGRFADVLVPGLDRQL